MARKEQALRRARELRPRRGRKRLSQDALQRWERGVTVLVISRGSGASMTSPTCTPVPWTVSGPPVTGVLLRSERVSCVHDQRGEVVAGWRNPLRHESDQARGRASFSRDQGFGVGDVPFKPTSREIKVSEAHLRALVPSEVLCPRSPHLRLLWLRRPLRSACFGWPAPVLLARIMQSTSSDAVQRRGDVAQPALVGSGARTCLGRARRAWSFVFRHGRAAVAPRSRVLRPSCWTSTRTLLRVLRLLTGSTSSSVSSWCGVSSACSCLSLSSSRSPCLISGMSLASRRSLMSASQSSGIPTQKERLPWGRLYNTILGNVSGTTRGARHAHFPPAVRFFPLCRQVADSRCARFHRSGAEDAPLLELSRAQPEFSEHASLDEAFLTWMAVKIPLPLSILTVCRAVVRSGFPLRRRSGCSTHSITST